MKRLATLHVPSLTALLALLSATLLAASALYSSAAPRAQAADEMPADLSLGVTVSGPSVSETPAGALPETTANPDSESTPDMEAATPEEDPSSDEASMETEVPPTEDTSYAEPQSDPSDSVGAGEVSYPGGAPGFDADGIPVGPDMTRAEESGLPMAGGVSASPAETLLQEAERRFEDGSAPEVLAVDAATGRLEYGA